MPRCQRSVLARVSTLQRLSPERRCWMAAEHDALVGHAQLAYDWRNGSARIGRVAVAPALRGRGLAKPMLRLIMAEAFADPDIERLELYAIAYNRHAIRIYENLGQRFDSGHHDTAVARYPFR